MLLEIKNLSFSYQPERPLFQNFNLDVEKGNIVALVGESGCGKSTLLSIIYGLLEWEGDIFFDHVPLFGPKRNIVPGEADMKLVAQNYDLMPYAKVAENVGKFLSNINLSAKKEKVNQLLELVGLQDFAQVLPKNLSGGQQQRVAIARALSVTPKLLLLDEPFSNLDFSRKVQLRENLFNYVKNEGLAMMISTHEIQEILPWIDELVVLQNGQLLQKGMPKEVFKNPVNEYVAELFGEVNVFSDEEQQQFGLYKKFYFPSEVFLNDEGWETTLAESRFSGGYYWNKIDLQGKKVIFYTPHQLQNSPRISFQEKD